MNFSYYEELAKTTNTVTVDNTWSQGRSVFGGLAAAMVLTYIETQTGLKDCDLRTVNVHFCGAAVEGEACELKYKVLSEGRSVIQIEGQLLQDGAIKTQIIACFSRARLSGVNLTPAPLVFTNSPEDGIKLPFIKGVAPGFIETPMTDELTDEQKQKLLGNVPAGRLGSSQEVAAAVSFLASEEAAYMTGATLHVNGGMAML